MLVEYIKDKEGKNLSKAAYKILQVFEDKEENADEISVSDLISALDLSTRAIHYSLQRLIDHRILDKRPLLQDMRQTRYKVSETLIAQMKKTNYQM